MGRLRLGGSQYRDSRDLTEGDDVLRMGGCYATGCVENGRVLGYDNSRDDDHRHFMGGVERIRVSWL